MKGGLGSSRVIGTGGAGVVLVGDGVFAVMVGVCSLDLPMPNRAAVVAAPTAAEALATIAIVTFDMAAGGSGIQGQRRLGDWRRSYDGRTAPRDLLIICRDGHSRKSLITGRRACRRSRAFYSQSFGGMCCRDHDGETKQVRSLCCQLHPYTNMSTERQMYSKAAIFLATYP